MALLNSFGLNIFVGSEIVNSIHHQSALFTLVNIARRTFLGGVKVGGITQRAERVAARAERDRAEEACH